jgi:GTP cyclohydrolase II
LSDAELPTLFGDFVAHVFRGDDGVEYIALVRGSPANGCLVRVHSECATGDLFGSQRCDCRAQLETSMRKIDAKGAGLLIYMRGHEGRGIGLANKLKAYRLQDAGADTVEANQRLGFPSDRRDYRAAAEILIYFGITEVCLMTNNPEKIEGLSKHGIKVLQRLPLWTAENPHNHRYLETKTKTMGHLK